jgi:hypothetical protein
VQEGTDKNLDDAKDQVDSAPAAPPTPEQNRGPVLTVNAPPTGICTTPSCPTPIVVVNAGDEPASGIVSVTSSSGGGCTRPFTGGPNGSAQTMFQVVNPANTSPARPHDTGHGHRRTTRPDRHDHLLGSRFPKSTNVSDGLIGMHIPRWSGSAADAFWAAFAPQAANWTRCATACQAERTSCGRTQASYGPHTQSGEGGAKPDNGT